jgi:polysaccharide export outer membrane protein
MRRSILFGLIGFLLAGVLSAQRPEVPRELLEYVRQARKAGLADSQIKLNAVRAGWPPEDLDAALAPTPKPEAAPRSDAGETPKPASKEVVPEVSAPKTIPTAAAATPLVRAAPAAVAPAAIAPTAVTPAPATKPAELPRAPGNQTVGAPITIPTKNAVDDEYLIGAGDVVQVSVWGEQSASVPSAVVRPDGKISMPLLKEVAVAGLTPSQAEKSIADQLDQFIKGANVTVVVSQINSKKIYLLGAVKKEGTISFTYKMTVMQALSEAGGLTDYAKRKKIYVIRIENGKEYKLPFDYNAVVKGERMELNIPLEPGDTIVVPH